MAEVIGLIASIAQLVQLTLSITTGLRDLHATYSHGAERTLRSIGRESAVLEDAFRQIQGWVEGVLQHQRTAEKRCAELRTALGGFNEPLGLLDEEIKNVLRDQNSGSPLGARAKARFLWNEVTIKEYRDEVRWMAQALHLLLSSSQLPSNSGQQEWAVANAAASIVAHNKARTIYENGTIFSDTEFVFDDEVINSAAYRRVMRQARGRQEASASPSSSRRSGQDSALNDAVEHSATWDKRQGDTGNDRVNHSSRAKKGTDDVQHAGLAEKQDNTQHISRLTVDDFYGVGRLSRDAVPIENIPTRISNKGNVRYLCDKKGCPRSAVGFETRQGAESHIRSHGYSPELDALWGDVLSSWDTGASARTNAVESQRSPAVFTISTRLSNKGNLLYLCPLQNCLRATAGFLSYQSAFDHTRTVHPQVKVDKEPESRPAYTPNAAKSAKGTDHELQKINSDIRAESPYVTCPWCKMQGVTLIQHFPTHMQRKIPLHYSKRFYCPVFLCTANHKDIGALLGHLHKQHPEDFASAGIRINYIGGTLPTYY